MYPTKNVWLSDFPTKNVWVSDFETSGFYFRGLLQRRSNTFLLEDIRDDSFGSNDFRLILLQQLENLKIDNSTGFRLRNLAFRYSYFGLAFLSASIALLAF